MSIVIDDCIKDGKDYNNGGARYNTRYIQGVGIGTITDTLSAIKHHVYDNERMTMRDLVNMLTKKTLMGSKKRANATKSKSLRNTEMTMSTQIQSCRMCLKCSITM